MIYVGRGRQTTHSVTPYILARSVTRKAASFDEQRGQDDNSSLDKVIYIIAFARLSLRVAIGEASANPLTCGHQQESGPILLSTAHISSPPRVHTYCVGIHSPWVPLRGIWRTLAASRWRGDDPPSAVSADFVVYWSSARNNVKMNKFRPMKAPQPLTLTGGDLTPHERKTHRYMYNQSTTALRIRISTTFNSLYLSAGTVSFPA
ncbi:uncharacterized protein EI97DRAFT_249683 [Westerdykella ornata]|uniref:Uncharacterized protein n=1 Tax=Westerdykella ornata TaxID=318751 RepID=A0A6A6JQ87_WESOR|nr:uncharacterized protein EI97DRAFT_249683 [Westerdykella ornata]KAF2278283.1 hypothetical protein EI97DRAFT_249683 [Westerdykella ornata]